MALAQLVYVSKRNESLSFEVLKSIVEISKSRNAAHDISGVLLCCGDNMMQLLEGELTVVTELFEHIRRDPRHSDVKCLLCKNTTKRLFPEWGMGLVDLESNAILNRDRLAKMLADIRAAGDTSHYAIEARVLLNDFQLQLAAA